MKNIIVTGAGAGIGYHFVRELLRQGHNVTVLDLDIEDLGALQKQYASLMALRCDVSNAREVEAAVKVSAGRFSGVDIAVHNACFCTFDSLDKTDDETYKDVFDVNYFGALHLTRAAVPFMKQKGGGKIVFTSSGVGVMGFVNISPYASSKGAIEALAKCLNIEYKKDGITFHIFHPPLTKTKSSEPLPVPKKFLADPERVGTGLAKHLSKKSYIICHSAGQRLQTALCYLFPIRMGRIMSRMTSEYNKEKTPV